MDKRICYMKPGDSMVSVPTPCASMGLQALLDKTAERFCMSLKDPLKACTATERKQLEIHYKWGCDRSKVLFNDFFITTIMPLKIVTGEKTLWTNPKLNKPVYCRPIQVRFNQINDDMSEDIQKVKEQIPILKNSVVEDCYVVVKHIVPLGKSDDLPISEVTEQAQQLRGEYEEEVTDFAWGGMIRHVLNKLIVRSDPYLRGLAQTMRGRLSDDETDSSTDNDSDDVD